MRLLLRVCGLPVPRRPCRGRPVVRGSLSFTVDPATQTLAVVVRGLALNEVTWDNARRVVGKEVGVGFANGLVNGIVAGVFVWLWQGAVIKALVLGSVISTAMLINLIIAAVAGTLVPLILKRFNADPAIASTVFVTTCTDVGGFLSFLGLATLFVKYLK